MILKKTAIYTLLGIFFVQNSALHLHAQSYTIKSIITPETELAPGTGLTIVNINVSSLSINNRGDILFSGALSDNTAGIILYSDGNIKLLAKSVIAQPLNESAFLTIGLPVINDNGEVVFCGNQSGKIGIFKILDDGFTPLVLAGDSVNGLESTLDEFRCEIMQPSINNSGEIAFNATLLDGRRGLFVFKDENVEPILVEGDLFRVFENETLSFADNPKINDNGDIVFRARFLTDIPKDLSDLGVFLFRDGEVIPVKLPGQEAPGTGGKVFSLFQFSGPALGNNSEVLYFADYLTPGIEQPPGFDPRVSEFGLFLWKEGETIPLMLTGEPTPGTNVFFANTNSFLHQNTINDFGDITVGLGYGSVGGVFLFSQEEIIPIALSEYPIFSRVRDFVPISSVINNQGDIAFAAIVNTLSSFDLTGSLTRNLFIAVRENVSFEVTKIEPDIWEKDSKFTVEVTGTGFQPGAQLSFSGNGIRVLNTKFKNITASTNFTATIRIATNARPGFHDVIVTNPTGDETVLENGFEVDR